MRTALISSVVFLAACSGGSGTLCTAAGCPEGCCDPAGRCLPPSDDACGTAGSACTACGALMTCFAGACTPTSGSGGGSQGGSGGGSQSGSGGGSSTGGAGNNGGGTGASCPCAPGSYCDLSSNTCKGGCRSDDNCASSDVCENQACIAACHSAADCGGTGHVCMNGHCQAGCGQDTECPLDSYCDNRAGGTFMCVAGCAPRQTNDQPPTGNRCNLGKACVPSRCADDNSFICFACTTACDGNSCASSPSQQFTCYEPDESSICRQSCTSDSSCPTGQWCATFGSDMQHFCARKCTASSDCAAGIPTCTCNTSGKCASSPGPLCMLMDPAALLP